MATPGDHLGEVGGGGSLAADGGQTGFPGLSRGPGDIGSDDARHLQGCLPCDAESCLVDSEFPASSGVESGGPDRGLVGSCTFQEGAVEDRAGQVRAS